MKSTFCPATPLHQNLRKKLCLAQGYFEYLCLQEQTMYRRYNNVLEGRRTNGNFRCPHAISRVPAPVPNTAETDISGNWHYYHVEQLPRDMADDDLRDIEDDFCPVTLFNGLIHSQGLPDVYVYKDKEGNLCAEDRNRTWQKICTELPNFIKDYTGADLADTAKKRTEEVFVQILKKQANKLEKLNIKLSRKNLSAIQTGTLKLKISCV